MLVPSSFTCFGIDYTITPPIGHLPPSRSRAASTSNQPAIADKHLIKKERKKLMQDGKSDPYNNTPWTGDEIIGKMIKEKIGLLPVAISPHGNHGPMLYRMLYGGWSSPAYKFPKTRLNAKLMYNKVMAASAPMGIIPLAMANWKRTKSKRQHFYGHSYTCPTPRKYFQQQMGLGIVNAIALHVRDVKLGNLVAPVDGRDEDFDNPLANF